jgi:hypothetical protein
VLVLCNFDSPLSRFSATVHQDTNFRRRAVGESFEVSEANDLCLLRIMLCGLFAGTTVDLLVKESVRCRAWHFIPANSCWPRGPRTILCPYTAHNRIRSCDYVTLCLHTILFPSLLLSHVIQLNTPVKDSMFTVSIEVPRATWWSRCHNNPPGRDSCNEVAVTVRLIFTVTVSVGVCHSVCVCEWVSDRWGGAGLQIELNWLNRTTIPSPVAARGRY